MPLSDFVGCGRPLRGIAPVSSPGLRSVEDCLSAMRFGLEGVVPLVLHDSELLTLGLCLHVTVEGCHSIRYPMCAYQYHLVIDVHHFGFVMVVAVEPDGVLITILD